MTASLSADYSNRGRDLALRFLQEITQTIGPPPRNFQSIEVSVIESGPSLKIDANSTATIYLGPNALAYEPTFIANIAHESVHLHEATAGYASGLEEAFALKFELAKIEKMFGKHERKHFADHLPRTYKSVLKDLHRLLDLYPNAISLARNLHGRLTGPTFLELYRAFPRVGVRRCYRLAQRKRMR